MKFKNFACAIFIEKFIFVIFFDVVQPSYKPLNFAWANWPAAMGQRVNRVKFGLLKIKLDSKDHGGIAAMLRATASPRCSWSMSVCN